MKRSNQLDGLESRRSPPTSIAHSRCTTARHWNKLSPAPERHGVSTCSFWEHSPGQLCCWQSSASTELLSIRFHYAHKRSGFVWRLDRAVVRFWEWSLSKALGLQSRVFSWGSPQ